MIFFFFPFSRSGHRSRQADQAGRAAAVPRAAPQERAVERHPDLPHVLRLARAALVRSQGFGGAAVQERGDPHGQARPRARRCRQDWPRLHVQAVHAARRRRQRVPQQEHADGEGNRRLL